MCDRRRTDMDQRYQIPAICECLRVHRKHNATISSQFLHKPLLFIEVQLDTRSLNIGHFAVHHYVNTEAVELPKSINSVQSVML